MLRIKTDKWKEFCNNAESLGFIKIENSITCNFEEYSRINIIIQTKGCNARYLQILTDYDITIENSFIDCLYDLISQGYVENVRSNEIIQ